MTDTRRTRHPLYLALFAVVALAVLTGGLAGVATAEVTEADRNIENTTLAPGETTEVTVTLTNDGAEKPALFEGVSNDLEIVSYEEEGVDFHGQGPDATEGFAAWDGAADEVTFTYEVAVSEDAAEGDVLPLTGDVTTDGAATEVTGDETIYVSEDDSPGDVVVDIDVNQYPMPGEELELTVSVLNPTDQQVDRDITILQDGAIVDEETDVSVGPDSDATEQFTVEVSEDRTAEVHAAQYGDDVSAVPVYVDVPDRKMGDVLGTGSASVFDILETQRAQLGGIELDPAFDQRVADVTRSGSIGVFDILGVQRLQLGAGIKDPTIDENAVEPNADQAFDVPVENPSSTGILSGFAIELEHQDTGETIVVDATPFDLESDGDQDTFEMNIDADTYGIEAGTYDVRAVGGVEADLGTVEIE